jgi:hypothetical protein
VTLSCGLFPGSSGQLVPNHRIGRITGRFLLGAVGPCRQHGVDDVQRDRPALLYSQGLQGLDDVVGGFPRDVGGDLVTWGVQRGVAMDHNVCHAGIVGQRIDHGIAQRSRCDDP